MFGYKSASHSSIPADGDYGKRSFGTDVLTSLLRIFGGIIDKRLTLMLGFSILFVLL